MSSPRETESTHATPRQLATGTGRFVFHDKESRCELPVFYHQPPELSPATRVLFVLHGVKRNAESYRDSWLPYARQHAAFLAVPEYTECQFPERENYNLGGLSVANSVPHPGSAFVLLERLFDEIRLVTSIESTDYLIYGHSAGAQFVHRLLLFHNENRAKIAVAANAGWYTLPKFSQEFPYGLANTVCSPEQLQRAFQQRLFILLGEQDTNESESHLRSTAEAKQQGKHRLERGHHMFQTAKTTAQNLATPLRWQLEVVPEVGHSNRGMASKAAEILFV